MADATVSTLESIPPLLRIEQFNCPRCACWVDPLTVLHRPFLDAKDCGFARFLYIPCEHCSRAWLIHMRYTVGSWLIDRTPREIDASLREAVRTAFKKADGDNAKSLNTIFNFGK